ncbi:MAG: hypothetical protein IPK07_02155 [Deltaproteobacteria bacterium]|nr:hypothetical protein [Deltaproteobacteria bacterium]
MRRADRAATRGDARGDVPRERTGTDRDLLPFLREQSISMDTQRHGWIDPRADAFLP